MQNVHYPPFVQRQNCARCFRVTPFGSTRRMTFYSTFYVISRLLGGASVNLIADVSGCGERNAFPPWQKREKRLSRRTGRPLSLLFFNLVRVMGLVSFDVIKDPILSALILPNRTGENCDSTGAF